MGGRWSISLVARQDQASFAKHEYALSAYTVRCPGPEFQVGLEHDYFEKPERDQPLHHAAPDATAAPHPSCHFLIQAAARGPS